MAPRTPPEPTPGIDLQPLITRTFAEIEQLEAEINTKTADLQIAREKLAAARGKLEAFGELQQLSAAARGQAAP